MDLRQFLGRRHCLKASSNFARSSKVHRISQTSKFGVHPQVWRSNRLLKSSNPNDLASLEWPRKNKSPHLLCVSSALHTKRAAMLVLILPRLTFTLHHGAIVIYSQLAKQIDWNLTGYFGACYDSLMRWHFSPRFPAVFRLRAPAVFPHFRLCVLSRAFAYAFARIHISGTSLASPRLRTQKRPQC